MLQEIQTMQVKPPPSQLKLVLIARLKGGTTSYQIETAYKISGRFVLRPTTGEAYQWLTLTAEQIKERFTIYPFFRLV